MMKQILDKVRGDRYIWAVVALLTLVSVLVVYSSTRTLAYKYQGGFTEYYLIKHLVLIAFGLILMYAAHLIDYRYYARIAQILLVISIPLLCYTLFFGTDINDAKRWITLPVVHMTFQTSDLAKLALIMYTATALSKRQKVISDFKEAFLPIIAPVLLICALIAPEDLSTSAILFASCTLLMFIGRIPVKYIAAMFIPVIGGLAIFISVAMLMPDQGRVMTWKNRIESFIDQDQESYQVQQSKIAIAKGGLTRLAPGGSTQCNFLPHPYSDFIYAIIIEEYGLIGGVFIMFLYIIFLFRSLRIALKSPGAFGALLAVGLSLSLVFQAFIHMAVAVNLLPVTGLTLPMISMGGTSLWFTSFSVGIILSVSRYIEESEVETIETNQIEPAIAT